MRRFVASICALAVFQAQATDIPSTQPAPQLNICRIQRLSSQAVGTTVTIKARIKIYVDYSYLWSEACPNLHVELRYPADGPTLMGCLAEPDEPGCGGVNPYTRKVVVTGVLKDLASHSSSARITSGRIATLSDARFVAIPETQ